jgi:hypothetical protein
MSVVASDPDDGAEAASRRAQQLTEEAHRSHELAREAQEATGRTVGALARMHDQMAAAHERVADLQETRANRPGADSAEREDLLTSAAEHREHAVADRHEADVGRREAAKDRDPADLRPEDS